MQTARVCGGHKPRQGWYQNEMPVSYIVINYGVLVLVGGTGVHVGGTRVLIVGTGVLVGGIGVLVGGTGVLVSMAGLQMSAKLIASKIFSSGPKI